MSSRLDFTQILLQVAIFYCTSLFVQRVNQSQSTAFYVWVTFYYWIWYFICVFTSAIIAQFQSRQAS